MKVCEWDISAAEEECIVVDAIDRFVGDEVVGYIGVK